MATKTITIDLEAYEALRRRKGPGESFSDVIKAHFRNGITGVELARILTEANLSEETLETLDSLVERRSADPTLPADEL